MNLTKDQPIPEVALSSSSGNNHQLNSIESLGGAVNTSQQQPEVGQRLLSKSQDETAHPLSKNTGDFDKPQELGKRARNSLADIIAHP
jgi:hypothetical protein